MRYLICIGLLFSINSQAWNVKPALAQKTYELWKNQKCPQISKNELQILRKSTRCENLSIAKKQLGDVNETSEAVFFEYAAAKQVEISQCEILKYKKITNQSADALKFENLIKTDLADKLTDLRTLNSKIKKLQNQRSSNTIAVYSSRGMMPELIEKNQTQNKKIDNELNELVSIYKGMIQSIWNINHPIMADYVEKLIGSKDSFLEFEKKNPLNKTVLLPILKNYENDVMVLRKQYNSKTKSYDLNQTTKELLINDGATVESLIAEMPADSDPAQISSLVCRLEARYGKGVQYLDNAVMYGSFALDGIGILAKLTTLGRVGAGLSARQAGLAQNTARVAFGTSAGIGYVSTVEQIKKDCLDPKINISVGGQCNASAEDIIESTSKNIESGNCAASIGFIAAPYLASQGMNLTSRAYRFVTNKQNRTAFIDRNLLKTFTTPEQNQKWIDLADSTAKKGELVFLDVENAYLKKLNDTTNDKNFITSLTNKHKEIMFSKIKEFEAKNPGLEVIPYSDFKSSRFAFKGKIPADLNDQLAKVFTDANKDFTTVLRASTVVKADDPVEDWFRSGIGNTADQANMAAKYSRSIEGKNVLQNYSSPDIQEKLYTTKGRIESIRENIERNLSQSTQLLEKVDGTNKFILKSDVIDVLRKSDSTETARESLKKFYGVEVTDNQALEMKNYVSDVDQFNPGIRTAKREFANFSEATNGGMSADFAGMGAANLSGTAKALAKADDLDSAIKLTRLEEKRITQDFVVKKENFENKVNQYLVSKKHMGETSVNCSGDDCVVITAKNMDTKTKAELIQRLSRDDNPSGMRVAFIADQIKDSATRNVLAAHGESVEKILRKKMAGEIQTEKLQKILFSVDVKGQNFGEGEMKLIIGNSQVQLTPTERQKIQNVFNESVKELNQLINIDPKKVKADYFSK